MAFHEYFSHLVRRPLQLRIPGMNILISIYMGYNEDIGLSEAESMGGDIGSTLAISNGFEADAKPNT